MKGSSRPSVTELVADVLGDARVLPLRVRIERGLSILSVSAWSIIDQTGSSVSSAEAYPQLLCSPGSLGLRTMLQHWSLPAGPPWLLCRLEA